MLYELNKKMRKFFPIVIILLFSFHLLPGANFTSKVKTFTLSNGMKFFVYERHQIPTFTGMVMVKVGSADERKGEKGIAHFFEHMAFKGTPIIGTKNFTEEKKILQKIDKIAEAMAEERKKGDRADDKKAKKLKARFKKLQEEHRQYVAKDEINKIYSENGGKSLNAITSNDTTRFFVMLPANRLELWFLIESERFKYPVLREFYSERDVILEEMRMLNENDPDGLLKRGFYQTAFMCHPYRHPVLGYLEYIQTFTKSKALNFFKTFYIPNNMAAALVGDIKFEEVKRLAVKYFGDMPKGKEPLRAKFIEPKQGGERRVITRYDVEPRIMIGYRMPTYPHKDIAVLDFISILLSGGNSSRLYRDLVTNKKIAARIYSYPHSPGVRYQSLFLITGQPCHPHTAHELENAIYEHLERLKKEPVPKKEIERVINQCEATLYSGLTNNITLAWRILEGDLLFGDIDAEFKELDKITKITPGEIIDTSRRIFVESNRTVGIISKESFNESKSTEKRGKR